MIIRISGDRQYEIEDDEIARLNAIDEAIEDAVQAGDEDRFRNELDRLLSLVRELGRPLAPDELAPSGLILPPEDVSLEELRGGLSTEGLIPDGAPAVTGPGT